MAFGRKGLTTPAASPPQANVQAAIGVLSGALGADVDFEIAYVFAPGLWSDVQLVLPERVGGAAPRARLEPHRQWRQNRARSAESFFRLLKT